jgi:hypothetical protein
VNAGSIVESGIHEQLVDHPGIYRSFGGRVDRLGRRRLKETFRVSIHVS